jgi:NAD-dependent deacetylase
MPAPREEAAERAHRGRVPICERCGGLVKPDVVLFGEDLAPAFREAEELARGCDLMLVLGSSLEVHPVAGLVPEAKESGAFVAMINREPSRYDSIADLVIHAELGPTMTELTRALALTL